jgi:hypothetical protein
MTEVAFRAGPVRVFSKSTIQERMDEAKEDADCWVRAQLVGPARRGAAPDWHEVLATCESERDYLPLRHETSTEAS